MLARLGNWYPHVDGCIEIGTASLERSMAVPLKSYGENWCML